jgi:flagellar motor switch protein FliG
MLKKPRPEDPMLTNAEKAVLFLLSLDEEVARPIVAELSEDDIRKLRTVASTMRQVPKDATQVAFSDFLERADRAVAVPRGGLRYLRRLSIGAIGEERARAVFEDITTTSPFARLEAAEADDVAALLANEPPQLAAAILSMLAPTAAAEILMAIGPEKQAVIVKQVSRMTQLPASVLEDVAAALAANLPAPDAEAQVVVDGIAKAAELLNASGKTASSSILATLEIDDPDLAATVRGAMFTFEDLERLDARAMRALLRDVSTERLTVALKNAPPGVLDSVFRGLSQRAAELIRDDLENMGTIRKADIEAARKEIVDAALRLDAAGTISLGGEEE